MLIKELRCILKTTIFLSQKKKKQLYEYEQGKSEILVKSQKSALDLLLKSPKKLLMLNLMDSIFYLLCILQGHHSIVQTRHKKF